MPCLDKASQIIASQIAFIESKTKNLLENLRPSRFSTHYTCEFIINPPPQAACDQAQTQTLLASQQLQNHEYLAATPHINDHLVENRQYSENTNESTQSANQNGTPTQLANQEYSLQNAFSTATKSGSKKRARSASSAENRLG